MLLNNILYIFSFIEPIDILNYSNTSIENKYYNKNSIIWKNLFMRDFYYKELKLDIKYLDIFFINKYIVDCIPGPNIGWLNLYKYNKYRTMKYIQNNI